MALQYQSERFLLASFGYTSIVEGRYVRACIQEVMPSAALSVHDSAASFAGMGPYIGLLKVDKMGAPEGAIGQLVAIREKKEDKPRLFLITSCHQISGKMEFRIRELGTEFVIDRATSFDVMWPVVNSVHQEVVLIDVKNQFETCVEVVFPINRSDHLIMKIPSFIYLTTLQRRMMRKTPPIRFSRFAIARFNASAQLDLCRPGTGFSNAQSGFIVNGALEKNRLS